MSEKYNKFDTLDTRKTQQYLAHFTKGSFIKNYLVLQREKERIPKCFEFGLVIFKDKKICFGNYLWVCLLEMKWRIETIVQIL